MKHRIRAGHFAIGLALALAAALAAGCSGKSDSQVAAKAAKAAEKAAAKQVELQAKAAQAEDEPLANAVVTGKSSAPVDLKYDISAKPAVGEPFEVELTFMPRLAADSLDVEISAVEGLTLVGNEALRFENVQAGERYAAKVLAQSEVAGMYYIGVSAKMTTKVQSEVRNFSIPIVVGMVVAAEKPEPARDAAGEAVESMPAVEPAK